MFTSSNMANNSKPGEKLSKTLNKKIKKRIDLTYDIKIQVLNEIEKPGATLSKVGKQFGISKSQVGRIKLAKEELRKLEKLQCLNGRKRFRKEEDVGEALVLWIKDKVAQGARISNSALRERAREIATSKGVDFNPTSGWLWRWKVRNGIGPGGKQDKGAKDTTQAIASHSGPSEGENPTVATLTETENNCGCSCHFTAGKPGVNIEIDIASEPSFKRPKKENTTQAEGPASNMLTEPNTSTANLDVLNIKNEPPDSEEWGASREEDVTVKVEVAEDEMKQEEWIPAEMEDEMVEDNDLENKNSDIAFYGIDERIIGETSKEQLETMNHSQLCKLIGVMSREIVRLQAKLSNEKLTQRDIEPPPDSDLTVIHNSFPAGMEVIDSGTQNSLFKSGTLELHPTNTNEKTQKSNESQPCNSVSTISNMPKSASTCQKKASPLQDKTNVYAFACGHICSVCNSKDTLTRLQGSYTSILPKVILIPTHSNKSVTLNEEPECSLEMTAENVSDDFNVVQRASEIVDTFETKNHITAPMLKSTDQREAEQSGKGESRLYTESQRRTHFKNDLCETSVASHETSDIPSPDRNRETEKLPPSLLLNQDSVGVNNSSSSMTSELLGNKSYDPLYYLIRACK